MTFARERLQVVEIDVDYCPLTYGTAPCKAVLGTTGVRKCYNTFATCQDPDNFGRLLEPSATPAEWDAGDVVTAGSSTDRTSDLFLAADVVIPAESPSGCVFEMGATGDGIYLGFTNGELVFRAGDGAALPDVNCADLRVDPADILGKTGTFYGAVDVSADQVQLWFYEPETKTLTDFGTATASGGFDAAGWSGSDNGGFGSITSAVVIGEDAAAFNGTAVKLRLYYQTTFAPTTTGNTLTLRYAHNQSGIPKSATTIFPALQSVSVRAASINLGGADADLGALGRRERVTVGLSDFTHHDRGIDKYAAQRVDGTAQTDEGGYDPRDRGTHFGKLAARWPHYHGRALRVKEGTTDQALSAMPTRHYVISEWRGPDAAGNVSITAKDILDLADNDKALCPTPSTGVLAADITADALTLTLSETGAGAAYTSGRVCIGSEIIEGRWSGDTFTVLNRGVDGTTAAAHSAGDTVQECFRQVNAPIESVVRRLLRDFAGIDPAFIPFTDWQDEGTNRWLSGFNLTTTIPKPVGVTKLLSELMQLGLVIWWDAAEQEIKMRALRPVDLSETVPTLSDDNAILAGSLARDVHDDKRLTRVVLAHGLLDYTANVEERENYRRFAVAVNPSAASGFEYDQERTLWIYSRWLGAGNDSIANPVALRTLNRYTKPPQELRFDVSSADRANVGLATVVSMTSRLLTDDTGRAAATQLQLTSVQDRGERLSVTGETFVFAGRYGYITEDGRANYAASSAAEIAKGTYIVGSSLEFGDGTGPYLMF